MSSGASLVSTQNHVQAPFIIVKIGDYTFGHCDKIYKNKLQTQFSITYPNYMESLSIVKINGAINRYTISMIYAITHEDDPNKLEKVFSSVSSTRMLKLSYGDWNSPAFIYKDEEAIITKLTSKVNLSNSTIQYTVECTSNALSLTAGTFSFPARRDKPSDVVIELLTNTRYNLQSVFKGMKNMTRVMLDALIARDDSEVDIEARTSITLLDYISYLVSCMVFIGDSSKTIKNSCYFWSVYDDTSGKYGGTYFRIQRVDANTSTAVSYNTYEVDIGYPTAECITDFSVTNDDSWALLYDYSKKIQLPEKTYEIDNSGKIVIHEDDYITKSRETFKTTEATRNWWSMMTQFPIKATLTMKGLLRPAMLMSYVKVNTYFYGHKHVSSGLYIITKQQDTINSSGYKTTLELTRVGGDESYA